jgi:hypothetical protein
MKQTSVEWLENQIKNSKHYFGLMKDIQSRGTIVQSNIFEQAKEMEKEQIKSAFTKGDLFAEDYFYPEKPNVDCSENYYNQTFNK